MASVPSSEVGRFAAPTDAERPKFRWYWPGAAVDDAELAAELQAMHAVGFRGAEIALLPIGVPAPTDPAQRPWGTPEYVERLRKVLLAARETGMRIDFTIGPGWPMVSPAVGGENLHLAQQELAYGTAPLAGGETFAGSLPAPRDGRDDHAVLVAVTAARVLEAATAESRPVLDAESLQDLTGQAKDGAIDWTAPAAGDWLLFAFWSRPTIQRATIAGAPTEGAELDSGSEQDAPVVDHFSAEAVKAATDFLDANVLPASLDELLRDAASDVFEDSLELNADQMWTRSLLDEFKARRGYDLTPYLPGILITNLHQFVIGGIAGITPDSPPDFELSDGSGRRLQHDYYRTLNELYVENHVRPLVRWANGRGLHYRAQPYGSTIDPIEVAGAVEIPECESLVPLWFSGGTVDGAEYNTFVDFVRGIAGGARMQGQDVVSIEACAIMNADYQMTFKTLKRHIDIAYAGGMTQVVACGFAYDDVPSAPWPGWSPFSTEAMQLSCSEAWGPRQPMWRHMHRFADYLARAATVLRHGTPSLDVALFRQHYWSHAWPKYGSGALADAGYAYGILSTSLLKSDAATVSDGRLAPSRGDYRALIVEQGEITREGLERIAALVEAGLPVVFIGDPPARHAGFDDAEAADGWVEQTVRELLAVGHVRHVATQDDVPAALRELGIRPAAEPARPTTVYVVHRQAPEGEYYFLFNHGADPTATSFALQGSGDVRMLDLWNGTSQPVDSREDGDRRSIELELAARETTVLFVGQGTGLGAREAAPAPRRGAARRWSQELGSWELEVEAWTPSGRARHQLALDELKDWREVDEIADEVGVGTYRTSVTLDAGWDEDVAGVWLDLGEVEDSIQVSVNGQAVSGDCVALRPLDVTAYLRTGENEIEIELATTLGNRLIAFARDGHEGYARLSGRSQQTCGLRGPVELIGVER